MIGVSTKGNFKGARGYLNRIKNRELFKQFEQYGQMGVRALSAATPVDTGLTAQSWDYRVIRGHRWPGIEWYNSNEVNETPVAILIQYGHGTRGGGYIQGRDFINPAMRPVFDKILRELREGEILMAGVDDAIVEMKFDNVLFEQKLNETIKSLDKLRASLDFSNSKKGMTDLSTAAKTFSMTHMGQGIDDISKKFLAMSTVGITALANITNKAVNAGLTFAKSFTMAPLQQGFQEFETNMNSIQTILANTKSKGSSLEDVERSLNQLNEYSDKTIYNFGEMARNIGTFTAAGVGLDDSVQAIKGIANLAAISGSSSEQASTAMYQLSQALAAGKVNLMDWNSVVNAGMGGEIFKKSLFETGKALGTIKDIPLGASFEEWEKKGGTFREQMKSGWLTADVLKTTLGALSGDVSKTSLMTRGFSKEAAESLVATGKMGMEAATTVKTFSQLIGTVKEAIGTGWADSFRVLIGGFDESKKLFTDLNSFIGEWVGNNADARNEILLGWKEMGGRDMLIQGFKDAFGALANIMKAVSRAFRNIFPKKTASNLFSMTQTFAHFTEKLEVLTLKWMPRITQLFQGLFAGAEIVWVIFKELGGVIKDLFVALGGATDDKILDFFSKWANWLTVLNAKMVRGGGIRKFFTQISMAIRYPQQAFDKLTEGIKNFFDTLDAGKDAGKALSGIGGRFEHLGSLFSGVGDAFQWIIDRTQGVREALGDLWNYITQFFRNLGDSMKEEMGKGDFEGALDIFNVAFIGGIAVMLRKFFKNPFKGLENIGGGLIEKINGMFGELTGTLKAMQTELKAKALMEIAIAMGVLTLSLVALSLIDSGDLSKALTAMAVGFAELIGAMVAIDKLMTTFSAVKFAIVAAGLVLLSGAMILLAISMKIMATMSWEEIARGLAGVAGGLAILVTGVNLLTSDTSGLVKAGASMIFISVGLLALSLAMKSFATMNWTEMGKGMAGVAGGLAILVTAMNNIDASDMIKAGLGIIAIAVGMRIMANALQAFATMSWEDLAKGLGAVIVALGAIVLLTNTMPIGGMIGIGAGLILVSVALNIMAQAVQTFAAMNMEELARGIGSIAAMMLILVIATNAMTGAVAGAGAMVIVAGALMILVEVITTLGGMDIEQLAIGIGALAAIFLVLGVAAALMSSVLAPLIGLGIALSLIGLGMAAFGAGAYLVIKAFELLSKVGVKAMNVLIEMIAIFAARAPLIGIAIASVIVAAVTDLAEAAPALIKAFKVIILELLDAIIEIVPKFLEVIEVMTDEIIELILDKSPDLIEAGITFILNFMKGIRDNIEEFINVGSEIIVQFLLGISQNDDKVIDTALEALQSFLTAIGEAGAEIALAGYNMLLAFLGGIAEGVEEIVVSAVAIITEFLRVVGTQTQILIDAGVKLITDFLLGVAEGALTIAAVVTAIITTFITEIGNHALEIVYAGVATLTSFLNAITGATDLIAEKVGIFIANFILEITELSGDIIALGVDALGWFLDGLKDGITELARKIRETGIAIVTAIANEVVATTNQLAQVLIKFFNGMASAIRTNAPGLTGSIRNLASAMMGLILDGLSGGMLGEDTVQDLLDIGKKIMDGIWDGLKDKWEDVKGWLSNLNPANWFNDINLKKGHAERNLYPTGLEVMGGLWTGLKLGWADVTSWLESIDPSESINVNDKVLNDFGNTLSRVSNQLRDMDEFNPVITPVLDLTQVRIGAQDIDKMMASAKVGAEVSVERARVLAVASNRQNGSPDSPIGSTTTEVTFNQTINSPDPLSANDIYRNTKSQIILMKEELKIA